MTTTVTPTPTPASTATRSRSLTVTLWTAQILLVGVFIFAAVGKLAGDSTQVESFEDIGFGQWFRYFTGVVELAGAIGLLIPRLAGLAAAGLAGVMVGATLTNLFLTSDTAPFAVLTVALGIVFGLIAWARRGEVAALVALLPGSATERGA